jgi:hypothetical protein
MIVIKCLQRKEDLVGTKVRKETRRKQRLTPKNTTIFTVLKQRKSERMHKTH